MRLHDLFETKLEEGPNDPHIFKAIFLAGGPGSGKSFVANKMLKGYGLKTVNSDDIFEYLMKKADLDIGDPDVINSPQVQDPEDGIRSKAKKITKNKEKSHIDGRLGLIIDGTGKDVEKVKEASKKLKELGYETMMLFVNTSEDIAQERNQMRPRKLDKGMVSKMWHQVQNNLMKFQQVFGSANFHVVDNSGGLEDPNRAENFKTVEKSIRAFVSSPPTSIHAKKWLDQQK
jgi:adenylate kinase family enzyme